MNGALIWFVVTLMPGGDWQAKPTADGGACRTLAAAYQQVNHQVRNGRRSYCVRTTVEELAARDGRIASL